MKMSEMPIPTTNPDPTVSKDHRTVFIMINLPLGTPMLVLMYVKKQDFFCSFFLSMYMWAQVFQ